MNRSRICPTLLFAALAVAPPAAQACGEGMFNTGKGLPYQAYLAPRPAAVLVFVDDDGTAPQRTRDALYVGLEKAGHRVTVVRDAAALRRAVGEQRYDVLISSLDAIDALPALEGDAAPAVLPVVARSARNSPQVRDRFDLFLLDGASLGQYLRTINKAVAARLP